jgi:hypothetical protein
LEHHSAVSDLSSHQMAGHFKSSGVWQISLSAGTVPIAALQRLQPA